MGVVIHEFEIIPEPVQQSNNAVKPQSGSMPSASPAIEDVEKIIIRLIERELRASSY